MSSTVVSEITMLKSLGCTDFLVLKEDIGILGDSEQTLGV